MNQTFTTILPIGLGVVFSPEILVLGMWILSLKTGALKKSWFFCAGGAVGIAIFLALGFFSNLTMPTGSSWTRFFLRAGLGLVLVILGFHILFKKNKNDKPMRYERYAEKISPWMAAGLGFFITGMNLKVMSLTMSAGHLMSESQETFGTHMAELAIFFAICMLPFALPVILETISHELVFRLMTPCDRFLKKYGNLLTAAILFIFGVISLKTAYMFMP